MSKDKNTFNPPWFMVIIMLGAFWPVGLYFLWCKMQNLEGVNIKKRNRRMSNGAVFMALFGLFLVMTGGGGFGAFLLLGGAALFVYDQFLRSRDNKFQRYEAVIGERATVEIREIASAMGVDYNTCLKDLQSMLEDKILPPTAYLDLGRGLYVRHSRYAPQDEAPREAPRQSQPQRVQPQQAQARPAPRPQQPPEEESEYLKKLTQIRRVNEAIKNEKVSAQIERIEQITGNIFEIVVEHPERKSQMGTFMNYYLPTTLKLLSTYAQLEKQGVAGENIESSKRNIEKLLDQLVWAFEQQNDQMFAREAMDINSDIKVMETMMARDGLTEGGLPKHPFAAQKQQAGR